MAIWDAMGGDLSFWLHIQNLCKNLVQMIYRSSWLVEDPISSKIWLKHRYGHMRYYRLKYWFSDFRFRIPVKFRSRWYINQHDWWRSNFPWNRAKTHRYDDYIWCHRWNFKFLTLDSKSLWGNPVQMIYRSSMIGGGSNFPRNLPSHIWCCLSSARTMWPGRGSGESATSRTNPRDLSIIWTGFSQRFWHLKSEG